MENEISDLREGILLGMGNPLLDVSAKVDIEFLAKYNMKAEDTILADTIHKNLTKELVEKYHPNVEYLAGGSVQNSLRVAQWILEKPNTSTFFGCVGTDPNSEILKERATDAGVNVQYQYTNKEPTGTCSVLITGQSRSLCAHLGAANCFTIEHIHKPENKKLIERAQYYYVSGFFLTVSPCSIQEIAKYAFDKNRIFMTNLSAPFISKDFKVPLMEMMPYVDLIFGNETEATTFSEEQNFNTTDLKEIALKMGKLEKHNKNRPRTVVITNGTDPVILAHDGEISEHPVNRLPREQIVDTNGAGDAFVGGFLAQYIQNRPLEVCIKCAIYTATEIIQRSGCTYEGKHKFIA